MMKRQTGRRAIWRVPIVLALASAGATSAFAQVSPTQSPFESAPAPQPPPPQPAMPATPPPAAPTAGLSREAQLEDRIRQLEAMVNKLSTQVQGMSTAPAAGAAAAAVTPAGGSTAPTDGMTGPDVGRNTTAGPAASPDVGTAASAGQPSAMGGASAPGQSFPPNPPVSARFDSPATLDSLKANVKFGPGFEIRTDDDEYILQFHNLTQLDYRGYLQGGQTPVHDSFLFPRQWFMFSGRLTKPFGYFVSMANGFDVFSILDVFLDVDYNPKLRIRAGRMKTPFTYEFFVEPIQGLVIPERSVFFNNFALNRDVGVMAFGRLLDQRVDYGVGIYNGIRNGIIDQDDAKAVAAYTNFRPFAKSEGSILENFNVGGSVWAGNQHHLPIPQTLRTIVPTTGNSIAGVPFLGFNNNVRESGPTAMWDLHMAWYYNQLAVVGEWGSGVQDYAQAATVNNHIRIPVQSFYVQASYLITGETRSSIGIVKPEHPFDIRKNKFGLGAWEPFGRYEFLDVSNKVFSQGLSDSNLWANRLFATHAGVNWHLTQYVKMYFDWTHDEFNQPVIFAPNRRQLTSDLLMVRLQVYF